MVDSEVRVVGGVVPRRPVIRMPQGFDMDLDIRFVGDLPTGPVIPSFAIGCQPRQGAVRQNQEPLELTEKLWEKLLIAVDQLFEWLNRSESNARLYFDNPAAGLAKAGVGLSVSELKTLDRIHAAASKQLLVGPGVRIVGFTVAAGSPACDAEQGE